MPNVTPQAFSTSKNIQDPEDTVVSQIARLAPTTTSTGVNLGVTSTALYAGTIPFIQKTVYAAPAVVSTTFNSNTVNQYVIATVSASLPVVLASFTQFGSVIPGSNNTQYGSANVPVSIPFDTVAWKVPVVADTVV